MVRKPDTPRSHSPPAGSDPTAREQLHAVDQGQTPDRASSFDPAASPPGTDDASGRPHNQPRVGGATGPEVDSGERAELSAAGRPFSTARRIRPVSPNIQIYRPQLTSVLSIANRITGVVLSIGAVGLVAWLMAGASGPRAYAAAHGAISSWFGQFALFAFTFAFFFHLCGGIRHLVWDTAHGFELRSIYLWGWVVVGASAVLTIVAWAASLFVRV